MFGKDIHFDIQLLSDENYRYIEAFNCGKDKINHFFSHRALNDKTSVTCLFIDTDSDKLAACLTIVCSAIFIIDESDDRSSTLIPAMEILYFAVDVKYQDLQYSRDAKFPVLSDVIFDVILDKLYTISNNTIGAAKIVLYSVSDAVNFYTRHGFRCFYSDMLGDQGYYVSNCTPMFFDIDQ